MINFPLCGVVFSGLKVTETLQPAPGANGVMHRLVTANGAAADSPVITKIG